MPRYFKHPESGQVEVPDPALALKKSTPAAESVVE